MPDIKLIAMDMDGTLLQDNNLGISPDDVAALRAAQAAGIQLALCSGRIPDDMSFHAIDIGVPMHILGLNGTCTLDAPLGNITHSDCIPDADARAIRDLLQTCDVAYGMFSGHDLMTSVSLSEAQLRLFFGANVLRPGSRTHIACDQAFADVLLDRGVNKYMIFAESEAPLAQVRARIADMNLAVDVTSSWINNLEVNPRGAHKGKALEALAAALNIPLRQVMAIGDNDNDIPMLQAAGVSVAMGNGTPNAKAATDYITIPNHQSGVAAAIRTLALGQEDPRVRRRQ